MLSVLVWMGNTEFSLLLVPCVDDEHCEFSLVLDCLATGVQGSWSFDSH